VVNLEGYRRALSDVPVRDSLQKLSVLIFRALADIPIRCLPNTAKRSREEMEDGAIGVPPHGLRKTTKT
jgi:hypothetical protein